MISRWHLVQADWSHETFHDGGLIEEDRLGSYHGFGLAGALRVARVGDRSWWLGLGGSDAWWQVLVQFSGGLRVLFALS